MKGKDQYGWPPYNNLFGSASVDITNIFYYYKTSPLNEEVSCTEPSPSVSVPCIKPVLPSSIRRSPVKIGFCVHGHLKYLAAPAAVLRVVRQVDLVLVAVDEEDVLLVLPFIRYSRKEKSIEALLPGQGKLTYMFSAECQRLSATLHPPPPPPTPRLLVTC